MILPCPFQLFENFLEKICASVCDITMPICEYFRDLDENLCLCMGDWQPHFRLIVLFEAVEGNFFYFCHNLRFLRSTAAFSLYSIMGKIDQSLTHSNEYRITAIHAIPGFLELKPCLATVF